MRDPQRLDAVYMKLLEVHKNKYPDMRIGQFLSNFFSLVGDPFYFEEDKMMTLIEKLDEKGFSKFND